MPRRAFTLVELLVVIAIMVTLMGLIMGGVMLAKRAAMRAKAVSLIGTVAAAIDQYCSLNNVYPERFDSAGIEVYQDAFKPGTSVRLSTDPAVPWQEVSLFLVTQLGSLISETAKDGKINDPWKQPLHYRPSKWYVYQTATIPRIDSENPPGQDSFQLWSCGPDAKQDLTDPGEGGDDIPQWAKK